MVILGNERLLQPDFVHLIEGRRVGLITNHSGLDSHLVSTIDRLHGSPVCQLVALFGPEHGVRGDAADGAHIASAGDPATGVPVHSLYGATQSPTAEMLAGIDVMVFDIQDVGARFYTYLYTMSLSMAACGARGIPFVVLDRPNPLGGVHVAGNILDPAFASFVGLYPIPIQYGMTIGELATFLNRTHQLGVDLTVVPLQGWERRMDWAECGLPWVAPSPNMPTLDTARVYPGTCFFEGTNLSEGRGTTRPFEQIGAPYVDGPALADHMRGLDLPGVRFRPLFFQPAFSKHQGATCQGVQLHVVEPAAFEPVRTGFELLAAVRHLWPQEFAWRTGHGDIYNFDRLAGTDVIRRQLDAGTPVAQLMATWEAPRQRFLAQRAAVLLYS